MKKHLFVGGKKHKTDYFYTYIIKEGGDEIESIGTSAPPLPLPLIEWGGKFLSSLKLLILKEHIFCFVGIK